MENNNLTVEKRKISTKKLCLTAVFTCITIISSWITVPYVIPFTLQTFAICLTACCLGLGYAMLSLTTYSLLGICGIPVFSGFKAGIGVLFGATGGYILGFFPMCLVVCLGLKFLKNNLWTKFAFGILGLILCYLFGTVWFVVVYSKNTPVTFLYAFSVCVLPYIIFDVIKVFLASFVSERIKKWL